MTRLSLFGCYHYNRRSVVVEELRDVAKGADAIAVEFSTIEGGWRGVVRYALLVPMLFLAGNFLGLLLHCPMALACTRDIVSTELSAATAVAEDRDVVLVDRDPGEVLSERSHLWIAGNWIVLVTLLVYDPVAVVALAAIAIVPTVALSVRLNVGHRFATTGLYLTGTAVAVWALLLGPVSLGVVLVALAAYVVSVFTTIGDRDAAMLEQVAALAEQNGYDEVCLATGNAHLAGQIEHIDALELELDEVFSQEWFRHGAYRDPAAVVEEPSVGNATAGVDPRRTDGVLRRRAFAAFVDSIGVAVVSTVSILPLAAFGVVVESVVGDGSPLLYPVIVGIVLGTLAVASGYYVFQEVRYGRTFGHRLAGVEVVSLEDGNLGYRDATLRTIYRLIDFLPVGYVVGVLVANGGDGTRRLGDRVAGTAVVRTESASDEQRSVD